MEFDHELHAIKPRISFRYEDSVKDLENEVCKLTKEKKELIKSAKVSEERRKKVRVW